MPENADAGLTFSALHMIFQHLISKYNTISSRLWTRRVYFFQCQQFGRAVGIPFTTTKYQHQQQDVPPSSASTMDVPGVSISTAIRALIFKYLWSPGIDSKE
jgi:hypothetical protein